MVVQKGDHILGIYSNKKIEIDDALSFLHEGMEDNEILMLITDRAEKDDLRKRMERVWKIDVKKLECSLDVVIIATDEFYTPQGFIDPLKIEKFLEELVQFAISKGKSGVRAFSSVHSLICNNLSEALVHLESRFDKKLGIPITAICAYRVEDMNNLTDVQLESLKEHHITIRNM